MENLSWFKIIWALLLGFMIWRMIPVAKHWMKNSPKSSGQERLTAIMLLVGVGLFIFFLIGMV